MSRDYKKEVEGVLAKFGYREVSTFYTKVGYTSLYAGDHGYKVSNLSTFVYKKLEELYPSNNGFQSFFYDKKEDKATVITPAGNLVFTDIGNSHIGETFVLIRLMY